jgi:hypothetical protein
MPTVHPVLATALLANCTTAHYNQSSKAARMTPEDERQELIAAT